MDKISNHTSMAKSRIVPYIREFDGILQWATVGGDRYQLIEDAIWYILSQLNVRTAGGFWLDLIGKKAGQSRNVVTVPDTLFTFVSSVAESVSRTSADSGKNGFSSTTDNTSGGLLLSKSGSAGNIFISLDDEIYRIYIMVAMIRNNYDCKRQTIIDAIKLLTGASKVEIIKTNTLEGYINIYSQIQPQYQYSMKRLILTMMPQCVDVTAIYALDTSNNLVEI